jgi:hypothetical protein
LRGHHAALRELPHPRQLTLQLCERRPRALLLGPRPAERRSRAVDGRPTLGARAFVEQRRRFRAHACDHLPALHDIARLELDAQHAASHW